jgi:osmotically-inducible protein OsmY
MVLHFRRGFVAVLVAGLLAATAAERDVQRDMEMERRIRARLARGKIALDDIKVAVRKGVAVLTGATRTPQRKALATRIARAAGASAVHNEIRIAAMGPVRPALVLR